MSYIQDIRRRLMVEKASKLPKLSGYCQYCLADDCVNAVHHEDAPGYYPFCSEHKNRNAWYYQWIEDYQPFEDELKCVQKLYDEVTNN